MRVIVDILCLVVGYLLGIVSIFLWGISLYKRSKKKETMKEKVSLKTVPRENKIMIFDKVGNT